MPRIITKVKRAASSFLPNININNNNEMIRMRTESEWIINRRNWAEADFWVQLNKKAKKWMKIFSENLFSLFFCVMSSLIIAPRVHIHQYMWRYSGNFQWRKKYIVIRVWLNESYIKSFLLLLFYTVRDMAFTITLEKHDIEICLMAVYAEAGIYSFIFYVV